METDPDHCPDLFLLISVVSYFKHMLSLSAPVVQAVYLPVLAPVEFP